MSIQISFSARGSDIIVIDAIIREFVNGAKAEILCCSSYQAGHALPVTYYSLEFQEAEHYNEFSRQWEASKQVFVERYPNYWKRLVRKIKGRIVALIV